MRERKKQRRYRQISETAISLFLERGFENVSVAEVAAAAEVSKPTLFRYFPSKEDLVLHRFADHEDEAARVVAGLAGAEAPRPRDAAGPAQPGGASGSAGPAGPVPATGAALPGDSALDRLLRHFLDGLRRRDPVTGLSDEPAVLAYLRLLYGTPSLAARLPAYQQRSEAALAAALGGGVEARLAAGQIAAVQRVLAEENGRRIAAGEAAGAVFPEAVQAAELAFARLRDGWGAALGQG